MRLLVDAMLPETIVSDAPAGVTFLRFTGSDVSDEDFLRTAALQNCRAAVVFDRNSLSQPGLRELATELGIGLVAVQAEDPVEAKERLLANFEHLLQALTGSSVVLVLATEARPMSEP
jgi:hypothetical protein